ncbi:unnamed protein product [Pieris brassicae]|uniref:RNA-directed DNA polymerase n=1 Tax=Pieris brassicae TaxID=7116 RepID=A0A9P0U023_PIEBR|nr:unnamed protein product [Pieris brassicae]
MANFYNKFIPNLASITNTLNNLLKKESSFQWTTQCEEAFTKIRKEILSERVLTHFDPTKSLVLATDASPLGLGAVLSHRLTDGSERPVAFASRTLSDSEKRYSQIDKEATAIHWGLNKFFYYIIITDHKPLTSIFHPNKTLPAMSTMSTMMNITLRPLLINPNTIATETKNDSEHRPLLQALNSGISLRTLGFKDNEFTLHDGCILRGARVLIPRTLHERVLNKLHIGHPGIVKMKLLARSFVYWKGIDNDIEKKVRSCRTCRLQQNEPEKAPLHHWERPDGPWQRLHTDFAGPF